MAKANDKKVVEQKQQKIAEEQVEVKTEQTLETNEDKVNEQKKETVVIKKQAEITEDAKQTKHFAWLAYLLFFIPLLISKNSAFVRHNANEGLEINIFDAIGIILTCVGTCVKTSNATAHLLLIICTIVGLGLLVLTIITKIYMIVVSSQGKKVDTPWMWNIKIIK